MNINVKNSAPNVTTIDIEGIIGVNEQLQFQENDTAQKVSTYEKFSAIINEIAQTDTQKIILNIRSMGGAVQDALLIYSALTPLRENITIETHCYGFSASAATIIAQAASVGHRYIASSALYMIHNSLAEFEGNANDAENMAEVLAKTDSQIAQIYASNSGLGVDHFTEIMSRSGGHGEWLTAQEAVELGLADSIEENSSIKNVVNSIKDFFKGIFNNSTRSTTTNSTAEDTDTENFTAMELEETKTSGKEDPTLGNINLTFNDNINAYNQDIEHFRG